MPNNNLFDSDTLYSATPLGANASTPVRCLGRDFKNDEARRDFFRAELRKQLPELRKLEGFPIGEDDDIISLSDPPFYTACPNPWLNDFIAEWEEDKKALVAKKKRKENHEVHEPYASDVSEGKNNPIYNAHSYHTKVPHPAIMRYILHYTQPGDIIYDGFSGTGMAGVAAQICDKPDFELKCRIESEFENLGLSKPIWGERKAICGDLSPIASFIAYNYNTASNVDSFEQETHRIFSDIETELGWMYETCHKKGQSGKINYVVWSDVFICAHCGGEIVFWDIAVDKEKGQVRDEFACPHCDEIQTKRGLGKAMITSYDQSLHRSIRQEKNCPVLINYTFDGKRYEKLPDMNDLELIRKIETAEIPYWFPTDELPDGDKTGEPQRVGITNVHHFYTKRNLHVISAFWERAIHQSQICWLLTGIMQRASKQHQIAISRVGGEKEKEGGKTAGHRRGTLFIPSLKIEFSVFELLYERKRLAIKALSQIRNRSIIQVASASKVMMSSDSIDYIFIDPPFGANIMYSELNYIWESFIGVKTNNAKEAIVNNAQKKALVDYDNIMLSCFKEYFRVLKPGRWITVEFSNTSSAVWNGIQLAIQKAGFIVANVSALDKQQRTHSARTTTTAVNQDLVISCYKPSLEFNTIFIASTTSVSTWAFVDEHLRHLPICNIIGNNTFAIIERTPRILYDRLISYFLMRGLPIPIDASDFQVTLKAKFLERDGMIFLADQAAEYEEQKRKLGITKQIDFIFDVIYSESDALAWLKDRLARKPQKYQDIQPEFLKANTATRKGEKEIELKTLLDENFIELSDGRYRCPDPSEEKDREALRTKALLKEFNHYLESASDPKTKKLKDLRVEALRAGFKACWEKKDFASIVTLGEKMPQNLLLEDEQLLMFYDIAKDRV
jgi:DNA modification methylase/DNA-directed RNA polymerase subunit RPC12/RpoP